LLELTEVEERLRSEFDELLDPGNSSDELSRECEALLKTYTAEASKLTKHRTKHAKLLSKTITQAMQDLSMTGGKFQIELSSDKTEPARMGNDTVTFMASPNTGVAPAPLAKVASGGELSRISLCLQLATLDTRSVPTLVFDEVDSGIGAHRSSR